MPTETAPSANAELIQDAPQELQVIVQQNALQPDTAQSLQASFAPLFKQAREVIDKSHRIVVTDASQKLEMKLAKACRLELKGLRVAGEKTRKELKEESLRKGKAIDGFNAILVDLIVAEESRLQAQEEFVERREQERKAALRSDREKILRDMQADPSIYVLEEMSQETFDQLVEGTKLARQAEAERRRKEEAERIERDEFEYGPAVLEERPFPENSLYLVREDGAIRRVGSSVFKAPRKAKRGGYLTVSLWANNREKNYSVHVIVALTYHGPRPMGHDAAHNDGNKLNCHRKNIRWKTRAENEADKVLHGTSNRGRRNGMSKLTENQVTAIRLDSRVQRIIAEEYGIDQSAVSYIKSGRNWRTV